MEGEHLDKGLIDQVRYHPRLCTHSQTPVHQSDVETQTDHSPGPTLLTEDVASSAPLGPTRTQILLANPERTTSLLSTASMASTLICVDWDSPAEAAEELERQGIKVVDFADPSSQSTSSRSTPTLFDPYSALGQYELYLFLNTHPVTGRNRTVPIPPLLVSRLLSPSLRFISESEIEERWLDIDKIEYGKFLGSKQRWGDDEGEDFRVVIPDKGLHRILSIMDSLSPSAASSSSSPSPLPPPPIPLRQNALRTPTGWHVPTLSERSRLLKLAQKDGRSRQFWGVDRIKHQDRALSVSSTSASTPTHTSLMFKLGLLEREDRNLGARDADDVEKQTREEDVELELGKRARWEDEAGVGDPSEGESKSKKRRVEDELG
ncbi:hypothetical protein VKT23_012949 [Stygiomarasmius scandens]|uniref:Uncharacterized protein n=1 Tax=Marasmiellus scandens TaxID=2682957 RepID=A0ABR1J9H2_9AGAR